MIIPQIVWVLTQLQLEQSYHSGEQNYGLHAAVFFILLLLNFLAEW